MNKHPLWILVAAIALAVMLVAPGVQATTTVFQSPQPAPPPNDNFANAAVISSLPYFDSVNMEFATTERREPQNCGTMVRTVWYKFSPASDIQVRISASGSNYDSNVNVYEATGSKITGLSFVNCASYGSSFTLSAVAGKTYYLQAGFFSSTYGYLQVNAQVSTPPPNDNFGSAKEITEFPYSDTVDIAWATTESGEPQYYYYSPQTVWYFFKASANAVLRADTSGSGFYDSLLNVYQAVNPGFGGLAFVGNASYGSSITFNVQDGATYYIQAGNINGCYGCNNMQLRLNLQKLSPPSNDNFTDAKVITNLPYDDTTDMTAASREANEPTSTCGDMSKTVWYAYTPTDSGSLSQRTDTWWPPTVVAVYTGSSLNTLQQVTCRYRYYDISPLIFHVDAGTTYYFQVGTNDNVGIPFHLEFAPPPVAQFSYYPGDPSIFDTVNFNDGSYDPAGGSIQSQMWDFGDGATATGCCVNHRYAADGDDTVRLTVTTPDGRTADTTQVVHVKTHDVAITKFTVPQSAAVGQTRPIVVSLSSKRYPETVQVDLFKSTPNGYQFVGTLNQYVPVRPANRTTDFSFSYTFTSDDATLGKVTFRAVATIIGARDALPADNEAISLPTKVTR